jgi:Fe-S cluster assembly protein SufD
MSAAALLPDAKAEGWRFTPVEALAGPRFEPAAAPDVSRPLGGRVLCPVGFHRAALVNGRLEPKHSLLNLPPGVRVEPLAESSDLKALLDRAPADDLPLALLAAERARDGIVVRVAPRVRVDKPIHLIHLSESSGRAEAAHVRVLIVLGAGASAEVVEESLSFGDAPFWKNARTQVSLSEDSALKHYRVVREGAQGRLTAAVEVEVGARARYESHSIQLGGFFAREDLRVRLSGEGADAAINGLVLLSGSEFADQHSVVDHAAVGGTTRQLCKAVLDDKSRFVFDGLIHVRPGAQKTDAQVYNRNLLLSEDARVNTNPEFKILADDVSCRHGGAIGQLSGESMFYLRSRGIAESDARRMLVYAFGSEMIERVGLEPLREALTAALHARMPEAAEGGAR